MTSALDPAAAAAADFAAAVAHYRSAAGGVDEALLSAAAGAPIRAFGIRAEGELLITWLVNGSCFTVLEVAATASLTISIPLDRIRRLQELRTGTNVSTLVEFDADETRYTPATDGAAGTVVPANYAWTAAADNPAAVDTLRKVTQQIRAVLSTR